MGGKLRTAQSAWKVSIPGRRRQVRASAERRGLSCIPQRREFRLGFRPAHQIEGEVSYQQPERGGSADVLGLPRRERKDYAALYFGARVRLVFSRTAIDEKESSRNRFADHLPVESDVWLDGRADDRIDAIEVNASI